MFVNVSVRWRFKTQHKESPQRDSRRQRQIADGGLGCCWPHQKGTNMQEILTSIAVLGVAILGFGDIVSLRVKKLFPAEGELAPNLWNEAQRAIARKYWLGRCGGETLLLVAPGLLAFFHVLPAWTAFAGLGVYFPIGWWLLRWVQGAIPQASGSEL